MRKLLTIVIPTYNMQDYLSRCLDSLIVEPGLMEQLEVLVVNDGSKDNSSAIAHQYQENYPNTFRVIDKENGNYGSCVNRGLAEAQGRYVKILDADDWFDNSEFNLYLNKLQDVDVDMILTPYNFVYQNSNTIKKETRDIPCEVAFDFNTFPFEKLSYYPMHMVTYRVDLLKDAKYCQTEGISYTDTEWAFKPQYSIEQFMYLPFVVYQYLIGREGQTMESDAVVRNAWHLEAILKSMISNRNEHVAVKDYILADSLNLQEIKSATCRLYKLVLLKRKPNAEELLRLRSFDEYLKQNCPLAYEYVASSVVSKWLPVHYVRYWRRTGKRFSIDWLRDLYRRMRYGKNCSN